MKVAIQRHSMNNKQPADVYCNVKKTHIDSTYFIMEYDNGHRVLINHNDIIDITISD